MENEKINLKLIKNLFLIIIFLILALILVISFKKESLPVNNTDQAAISSSTSTDSQTNATTTTKKTTVTTNTSNVTKVLTEMCNLKITYPTAYSKITFPLTIKGNVDLSKNYDCKWSENLSRAGSVQIFYNLKNTGWKSPGIPTEIYTASSGGSTTTLALTAPVNMYTAALGLPSGTPIKLVFTELNIKNISNPKTFSYIVYLK